MTMIALTSSAGHRPHPFRSLLRAEFTLFRRSAGAVLWSAVLPLIALVVLGSFPAIRSASSGLHGISYLDAYLPVLMMFSLCIAVVNTMPPALATYREKGILRRLSVTPVPPSRLLAAQATIYIGVALVVAVAMVVVGVSAYGIHLPHELPGFVLSLLLVAAACTGLGTLIAALAPTGKAANAISLLAFYPLMFLAGLWLPRAAMPTALRTISDYSPLGAGVRAVQATLAGHWPPAASLLVLAGYAVVLCSLAVRLFRWE